jgi:hypothetical protein
MSDRMQNGNTTPTNNRGDTGADVQAEDDAVVVDEREDAPEAGTPGTLSP